MTQIHYATDNNGYYQVAPGDFDLAVEYGLPTRFPPDQINNVVQTCKAKNLEFTGLGTNIHEDVYGC